MRVLAVILVVLATAADVRAAQDASAQPASETALPLPATICDLQVPEPASLPPADSPPVVTALIPCFQKQGGATVIEANT